MSELVKDLHGAGVLKSELDPLDSSVYQEVEDDVTRRVRIWAASKKHSKGNLPRDQFAQHILMTSVRRFTASAQRQLF